MKEDWLEGTADEEKLADWLRENPDRMRDLVEASFQEQLFREAARAKFTSGITGESGSPKRSRRLLKVVISTMALAAVIFLATLFLTQEEELGVKATTLSSGSITLGGAPLLLEAGDSVNLGHFRVEEGSLEVSVESGVSVRFFAPLEARFESPMRLHLIEGYLNADVGDDGKGFTVTTAAGKVVDLGTRFGVEADRDGESRVAVFSGSVEVHPHDQDFVTLIQGQAVRFSESSQLERWEQVALAAKEAGLDSVRSSSAVRRVEDNLGHEELQPFYGVVAGGMTDGALAYTDKPNPRWQAMPKQDFPAWLEGADLIRTYHRLRGRNYLEISVEVNIPATVYILFRSGEEVPTWLNDEFEDTGAQIRVGPWHPDMAGASGATIQNEDPYLTISVWQRKVEAGTFVLGSPRVDDSELPIAMYGIAVKARSEGN